jgi:membrane protein YqaA with SNARE-associated domain
MNVDAPSRRGVQDRFWLKCNNAILATRRLRTLHHAHHKHHVEAWLSSFLETLSIPGVGLPAIFVWATISATLLPLGSEAVVFGYVKLNPHMFWPAILVATAGNTLGGMINYWLAFGVHQAVAKDRHTPRALVWFEKLGPKALFFSFLPAIGDPLTAVAGWLKLPWLPCLLWQAAGKFLRYLVATALLLWVPDSFWTGAAAWFKAFSLGA